MINYIKESHGDFKILARDHITESERKSIESQNSLIFQELMKGRKLKLFDVIVSPIFCSKLGTRISDIRKALAVYGIEIKHTKHKNHRGSYFYIYFLDPKDIKTLEKIS